jgi:HSP20 family protein
MTEAPVEVRKAAPLPVSLAILEPWNLWRGEFDRVFGRMFAGGIPPLRRLLDQVPGLQTNGTWPAIDVSEEKGCYRIHAELPGMAEGDVELSLRGRMLVLRGEKKRSHDENGADWHLSERSHGRFERDFSLPESVDSAGIEASFDKGLLTVTLPKRAEAPPESRRITVTPSLVGDAGVSAAGAAA